MNTKVKAMTEREIYIIQAMLDVLGKTLELDTRFTARVPIIGGIFAYHLRMIPLKKSYI